MKTPFKTVLIGFGKVGHANMLDPRLVAHYKYITHLQVLLNHPDFSLVGIVDPSIEARNNAQKFLSANNVYSSLDEIPDNVEFDVAIIASPGINRLQLLKKIPHIKFILMEKPLAQTIEEALAIKEYCQTENILVQVNYWRRADRIYRKIILEKAKYLGEIQAMFSLYGSGLLNNGTHMIDFARMIAGEVQAVQSLPSNYREGPNDDVNVNFNLIFANHIANFQALSFKFYRECSMDIWGTNGRVAFHQEGLKAYHYLREQNRSTSYCNEISTDKPQELGTTAGLAFYEIYSNFAQAIQNDVPLLSSIDNAITNMQVIDAIHRSQEKNGCIDELKNYEKILGVSWS